MKNLPVGWALYNTLSGNVGTGFLEENANHLRRKLAFIDSERWRSYLREDELINAISWHLECMVLSRNALDNFRPPADVFQMRMHYSLYATNLMSMVGIMIDQYEISFKTSLQKNLETSDLSGHEIFSYLRELRNGIVHRGIDPTAAGEVINGVTRALAPSFVSDQDGRKRYRAPARILSDVFNQFETAAKPVIQCFLESAIHEFSVRKSEELHHDYLKSVEQSDHMPEWAKKMAYDNIDPKIFVEARANCVRKLRDLLTVH